MADAQKTLWIKLEADTSQANAKLAEARAAVKMLSAEHAAFAQMAKSSSQIQAEATAQATAKAREGWGWVRQEIQAAAGQVQSFGSAMTGLAGASAVIGGMASATRLFADAQRAVNESAARYLETLMDTKSTLREIATIKGISNDDRAMLDHLALRKATGMDRGEASNFALEYAGAGAGLKGLNIGAGEYDRLESLAGRFAKSQGGGAAAMGTYGKLTGLLLGYKKYDSAEQVMSEQARMMEILSAGVGDNPTLVRQSAEVAGRFLNPADEMKGSVKSTGDLAALISTASRVSPTESADILRSIHRSLNPQMRGIVGRKKGMWGSELKELGITEGMDDVQRMQLLFGEMERQEKGGRRVEDWLKEAGISGTEEAGRMVQMYNNRGFLNKMLGVSRTPLDKDPMKAINRRYATDSGLAEDVARQSLESTKLGAEMPYQSAGAWEMRAEERLRKQGYSPEGLSGWFSGLANGAPVLGQGNQELGWKIQMEQEMYREAVAKGLGAPAGRPSDIRSVVGAAGNGKGFYGAEYMDWIASGEYRKAYGALGEQERLTGGVTPTGPDFARADERIGKEQTGLLSQLVGLVGQLVDFNAGREWKSRPTAAPGKPPATPWR